MSEPNRAVFNRVGDSYIDLALKPAERSVLKLIGGRLRELDMLDLGVGTGRTGYTFAPLVRRYVGVDYAPEMLKRARDLLGGDDNVELIEADARDLSGIDGSFGFVLFSFNGIDAVGHEDRLRVLAAVRAALAPDGYFLFSTHSMGALPLATKKQRSARWRGSRAYEAYARLADVRYGRRIRQINAALDLDAARERGWVVVPKMGHNFQVDDYYVDPEHQVAQLREVGLEVETVFNVLGQPVALPYAGSDPWLDYLCRPAGS